MRRRRTDGRVTAGGLEVFDVRVVDEPPPVPPTLPPPAPVPRACRWHLWHRWALIRVDGHTTYVACRSCGRMRTPTLFEAPVP